LWVFQRRNSENYVGKNSEFSKGEYLLSRSEARIPQGLFAINILFFARYHVPAKRSQGSSSASHLSFEIMG